MRKPTIARILILALALLAGAAACERNITEESSVLPSSTAQFTFDMTAFPNVLYATGASRDSSLIKLVVRDGGTPLKDVVVFFSIVAGPAVFSDYTWRVSAVSNENGIASATLLGPLLSEFNQADTNVVVAAEVEATAPQSFRKEISLRVLGPAEAGVTISLTAYPAILTAFTSTRDTSVITAVLRDGILPLQNASVQFTLVSGLGMFAGWTWHVTVATDENGIASVILLGPMSSEMTTIEGTILVSADVGTANAVLHKEVTVKVQK